MHKHAIVYLGLAAFCGLSTATCKQPDQPRRDIDLWRWASVAEPDFNHSLLASYSDDSAPQMVSNDDARHQRLAKWINKFHQIALSRYAKITGQNAAGIDHNIPAPKLRIVEDSEANAYVPEARLCINVPIHLKAPAQQDPPATKQKFIVLSTYDPIDAELDQPDCIETKLSGREINNFINWYNTHHPTCKFSWNPQQKHNPGFIEASQECPRTNALANVTWASGFTWSTTSDWIVVHSGLINFFKDEEQLLSIIAHELGHYYLTHHTIFADEYDIFFDDSRRAAGKPDHDSALLHLGKAAIQASRFLQAQNLDNIESRQINSPTLRSEAEMTLSAAHAQNLGYYTTEQEADEFAMNLMIEAGFSPGKVVDAAIDFYFSDDNDPHAGASSQGASGWSKEFCQKKRPHWLTNHPHSKPPIADFYDEHHSACYRAYNLTQEMIRRGYRADAHL